MLNVNHFIYSLEVSYKMFLIFVAVVGKAINKHY